MRSTEINGEEYYLYDVYVDMDITYVWVRGLISASDRSGLMHTILILTAALLPAILVLSTAAAGSSRACPSSRLRRSSVPRTT